ncbi:FecR family protein [Gaoshiqia sp. Z1-71]|uniref:FecR family protein n=1 Tax=Gaoshiqia hydrogeniformans TaxID=3290090 RepID=UPI003BF78671
MTKNAHQAFRNFLDNSYSKADYLEVLRLFESGDEFKDLSGILKEHWNNKEGDSLSEESCKKLQRRVREEVLLRKYREKRRFVNRFASSFSRVAAILLLPLFLVSAYFFIQWKGLASGQEVYAEIYCPPGTRTKFNLPDGTTGWLNSYSRLKYPVQFANNRHIELSGEAWFDVKKDPKSPFVVHADGIEVEALGTQFNVLAYPFWPKVEVSLEEGSVQVTWEKFRVDETLVPNQRLVMDKVRNSSDIYSGDTNFFTSWKDGLLVFRNTPLFEVAARLSLWYNTDIILQDRALEIIPFRATFKNESLERVLSLLSMSVPISYQIIEPKTTNGIYEKQKVIISYKN